MTVQALKRRFAELLLRLDEVEQPTANHGSVEFVDKNSFLSWCLNARNLLKQACGAESEHYKQFQGVEKDYPYSSNREVLQLLKAVFSAAKEDYEGGYLRSIRSFVHAELFDDELKQAGELLSSGYTVAAAVVARVVLETKLRALCDDSIPIRTPDGKPVKLDKMNADLVKAGVYDLLVQKQVTWLAGIGNDAAHGKPVKDADVEAMIEQVRRFVTDHPTV